MTEEICGCLDNDEKIILLKCLESAKIKNLKDIDNQISIEHIGKMRDDIKKLERTIDRIIHMPLC